MTRVGDRKQGINKCWPYILLEHPIRFEQMSKDAKFDYLSRAVRKIRSYRITHL